MPVVRTQLEVVKKSIPGWGADLDPAMRPGVPREANPPGGTGAHWEEPERQIPRIKILVSNEHAGLTPVFGTSCPPQGLSGKVREWAFRFSEGQKPHWLLLILADRINEVEGILESVFAGKVNNPLHEMGLKSELKNSAFRSRFGQHRTDVKRQGRELMLVAGLGLGYWVVKRLRKAA